MKKIFLLLLPFLVSLTAFHSSKDITITGIVTDMQGNAISASVNAGKIYAVTDAKGYYRIIINEKETHLTFSAIGYSDQKIRIADQKMINVKMQPNTATQEEAMTHVIQQSELQKVKAHGTARQHLQAVSSMPYRTSPGNYENKDLNTEDYNHIAENGFKNVLNDPLSTFSIDVDAASYSNVRRYLQNGQLPPAGAVRTEEMINYFKYDYPQPKSNEPFSITTELGDCPWNADHRLLLVGLQGKNISAENLPASNLVFLVDVSGSMMAENKLPLVKASLKMLTDQLRKKDKISIVVYAGQAGLVLPATNGDEKMKIKTAIDALQAGGSTAGGAGIQLAYSIAQQNMVKGGNNRVILCSDGDFNVGTSSDDDMVRLIEKERNKGIYLTVLGYGMGNYKDNKMQQLADKGNGNHAYIDELSEAKKVLVNEFGGTLFTIAKDVKLQVEFNPESVAGYRLIGYENRLLNKEDFNDDKKDAGELGSGHSVTALYEIIPAGVRSSFLKEVDPLKYQPANSIKKSESKNEIATIKFRYKQPDSDESKMIVHAVNELQTHTIKVSNNLKFASAVAGFAMLLRDSEYKGTIQFKNVIKMGKDAIGEDAEGYQKEFVTLVEKAAKLKNETALNDQ